MVAEGGSKTARRAEHLSAMNRPWVPQQTKKRQKFAIRKS
jgi:hypothetical protein